jgi:hypothetical protein
MVSLGRIAFDQEDRASASLGRAHFEGCILHTVTKCSRSYRRAASGRAKQSSLPQFSLPSERRTFGKRSATNVLFPSELVGINM